jgi:hypothetical protein
LLTSGHKPIWSVPGGSLAPTDSGIAGVGQTKQIALGHLGRTPLDNREVAISSNLIHHLGFADTVPTAHQHGKLVIEDMGYDCLKGFEVY